MPHKRAHQYITIRQALKSIFGLDPDRHDVQRFRRAIMRKEAISGATIAIRLGPPPSPVYVTEAVLRDMMPELFSRRDHVVELLSEQMDEIREDLEECRKRDTVLARRIRALARQVAASKGAELPSDRD